MIDPYSKTWLEIKAVLLEQQDKSRRFVESVKVDERTADHHRGRLTLINEMLKLEPAET